LNVRFRKNLPLAYALKSELLEAVVLRFPRHAQADPEPTKLAFCNMGFPFCDEYGSDRSCAKSLS
jgi:hypothetical protein